MEKSTSYGLLIIAAGILIGFGGSIWSCGPVQVEGLLLVDGTSSIGSDENGSYALYKYSFTLYNSRQNDVLITTVEPVLAQSPYIMSSQDSLRQEVNTLVETGSSITIEGAIKLNTENVSKEELMEFEPILYINVSSTETIPYFDH